MAKRLVFTGGHHTGALEVAKKLQKQGVEIYWFGHRHTMWGDKADSGEYRDVVAVGIPFYDLLAGKFYRTFNPLKLIRIPWGFIQAFVWLVQIKPDGIVSFGGYLAVPVVITGWLLGIKSITHEQTIVAGWANKLIGKFASKIALTWPQSQSSYPAAKTAVVGLPVRPEIAHLENNPKKSKTKTIFVTGGKQGAHVINKTIFSALDKLNHNFKIIHQTGNNTIYNDFQIAQGLTSTQYECFDYDSGKYLQALLNCDLVIGRAGAHTVYDLALLGKKSVLIPIPWVSHNEQYLNAKFLSDNKLSVILRESELTEQNLLKAIDQALQLSGSPLDLPRNAVEKLVDLIKKTFAL